MGIYQELGMKKVVNAWGTVTKLGGSLMEPEVLEAMRQAAGSFVNMEELHAAAGERIAQLVVIPYLPVGFAEVDELGETDRGSGGFGSTGK